MSRTVLVDDHLLLRFLLDDEPRSLRRRGTSLATTGLWYHRLCRALADQQIVGSMSRRLGDAPADVAARVVGAVVEVPDEVEVVPLRTLGWSMAQLLQAGVRLNLLSLEALAAARHLGAGICLAEIDANEPLRAAATDHGVAVRVIPG